MPIPADVIIPWVGTNASIPSGFTRETSLDTYYVKSVPNASTQGGTAGGNATHTHAQSAHASGGATHGSGTGSTGGGASGAGSASANSGSGSFDSGHVHPVFANDGTAGFNADGTAGFSGNNDPAYFIVIFIKSNGTAAGIPTSGVALWHSSTLPLGWRLCDGASGAPNIGDRYLKGAIAAGDGGGTGGSNTHQHTEGSHSHGSSGGHSHSAFQGGSSATAADGGSIASTVIGGHSHSVGSYGSASPGTGGPDAQGTTSGDSSEVPYRKILYIQNNSGTHSLPKDIIAIWLGTPGSVPAGWAICDGGGGRPNLSQGEFLKGGTTTSDFGTTGGVASHSHGGSGGTAHSHSVSSHTHSGGSLASTGPGGGNRENAGPSVITGNHSHSGASVNHSGGSSSGTSNGAQGTGAEPVNKTVMFIQNTIAEGGFLLVSD